MSISDKTFLNLLKVYHAPAVWVNNMLLSSYFL